MSRDLQAVRSSIGSLRNQCPIQIRKRQRRLGRLLVKRADRVVIQQMQPTTAGSITFRLLLTRDDEGVHATDTIAIQRHERKRGRQIDISTAESMGPQPFSIRAQRRNKRIAIGATTKGGAAMELTFGLVNRAQDQQRAIWGNQKITNLVQTIFRAAKSEAIA